LYSASVPDSITAMIDSPGQIDSAGTRSTFERLCVCLATGLGLGVVVPAPGTAAAVVWGMPLAWGISGWTPGIQGATILGLVAGGVLLSDRARRAWQQKDPSAIVWDEIVSVPMTFYLVPLLTPTVVLSGLALNRLFDITKPLPAQYLEQLPGGWGIMADDCLAGVYSCLALHALLQVGWLQVGSLSGTGL